MSKRIESSESADRTVDYDKAAAFVFSLPAKPVNLLSIDPTNAGPPRAQTFEREKSAATWMEKQQAEGRNLYYQDCAITVKNKRPKKNDVATVFCTHVDAEVQPKDTPSGPAYDSKRQELLQKLLSYPIAPTTIIDSGNGWQAFWYLAEPIKATDDNIRRIEAINMYWRAEFGGDACHDVAHVMRVPHTKNFPNALKRKLGRVECISAIVLDNHDADFCWYNIDTLPTLKTEATVQAIMSDALAGSKGEFAAIGAPDIPERVDLYKLPERIVRMIQKGAAGSRIVGDGSRSDLIYHIACEMRRREYSDGDILATITNPDYEISSHYRDNPQREQYDQAARVIQRMNKDGVVAEADRRFLWDDECQIVIKPAAFVDRANRELISHESFNMRYNNLVSVKANAATIATHSRHMDRFAGLCYRPNRARDLSAVERRGKVLFNTWQPQDTTELKEEPTLFLEHVNYLIPDEGEREMLLDWLAHVVQHPEKKTPWAIVLVGPHGTGKSWIAEVMKMILGIENCSEPPMQQITSEFNSWMAEKQLVIIHELKRTTRDGALADALKDLITQPTVRLNRKGIEPVPIDNTANFFTITNEDDAVDMESTERRYAVPQCADLPYGANPAPGNDPPYIVTKKMTDYYMRLWEGMSDEEVSANVPTKECRRVLWWLLNRKGGNVKLPIVAPATRARSEMIDANRSQVEKWLRDKLLPKAWPFTQPVFNVNDILERLPNTVPLKEQSQRAVEKACKAIGCKPLGGRAIDMGELDGRKLGEKRLWARDGAEVAKLREWPSDKLAEAYRAGLQGVAEDDREPWEVNE